MERKKIASIAIVACLILALAGSMLLSELVIGPSVEEPSNQEAASSPLVPPAGAIFTGTKIKIGVNQGGTFCAPGTPPVAFQYPIGNPNEALAVATIGEGYVVAYKVWTGAVWESRVAYYEYTYGWPPPAATRLVFVSAWTTRNDAERATYRAVLRTVDGVLQLTFDFDFPKAQACVELRTTITNLLTTNSVRDVHYKRLVDWDVHQRVVNKWTSDGNAAYAWLYNSTTARRYVFSVSGYTSEALEKLPTYVDLYAWDDRTIRGPGTTLQQSHEDPINSDGMAAIHYDLGTISATSSSYAYTVYQAAANTLGMGPVTPIVSYKNIGSSSNIPTTPRNLGNVTLSAPTNGYVVLTAVATIWTFGDGTRCWFGLGTTPGSVNLHMTGVGVLDGTGTQRTTWSATSEAVVRVTPGSYTLYVTAYKDSTFARTQINMANIYLTAVFYGT